VKARMAAKVSIGLLVWVVVTLSSISVMAAGIDADLVIYNGKILTANSPDPAGYQTAQAAAVYDGKFVAVGTNEEVLAYAGPKTRKIDLGGRTVLPGLVESHDHVYDYAVKYFPNRRKPNQDPPLVWTTKDEGLAQLKTIVASKKPGEWINTSMRGGGFGSTSGNEAAILVAHAIQKAELRREDLDKVSPNNPVRVTNIFFSPTGDSFVNSKGLELLLKRYPNIVGIHKDPKGVPTGWLSGVADRTPDYEFYPPMEPAALAGPYKMQLDEEAAQGITTISSRLIPQDLATYSWMERRGELPIRFAYTSEAVSRNANAEATYARIVGMQGGQGKEMWGSGNDMIWTIGVAATFSLDSISSIGGSCVRKDYPREAKDFPLWMHQFYGPHGLCRLSDPNYDDANGLMLAAKYGFRAVATHADGDRGIDDYLDLMEKIYAQYPHVAEQRWTLEHCPMLHGEQIQKAKKFNLMFSCGAFFLYGGMQDRVLLNDEKEAADSMIPFRSLIDNGLRAVMQLDADGRLPLTALQIAVTRKDINGKVWGPQQAISRNEALYTYTRWSSEFVLREDMLGSIEPKKAADFVVLNRDYLTVPEDEIGRIDAVLTVVGGKFAYTDPDFANSQGLPQVGFRGSRERWLRGGPEDRNRNRGGGGGGA
jgi:predicted amidohydrolase YtcJ